MKRFGLRPLLLGLVLGMALAAPVGHAQWSSGGWAGLTRTTSLTVTTGPLLLPNGTAAAPALAGTNFATSGLWFETGPVLHLSLGASAANGITLNSNGELSLGGSVFANAPGWLTFSRSNSGIFFGGDGIVVAASPGLGLRIRNGPQTDFLSLFAKDGVFSGAVSSANAAAGIGYATGAGGAVTQLTSKATGVTLNTVTGEITMNAAALAANTTVAFTLTNSAIAATDALYLQHQSGGTAGAYTLTGQTAAGSATISIRNVTAGSLAEAIVVKFVVIKAVTS